MSDDRKTNSIEFIKKELLDFSKSISNSDTVRIITFTDKILSDKIFDGTMQFQLEDYITAIVPMRGNSDIIKASSYVKDNAAENCVFALISDGLHNLNNAPKLHELITDSLKGNVRSNNMLLLNSDDLASPVARIYDTNSSLRIIHSLSELNIVEPQTISEKDSENEFKELESVSEYKSEALASTDSKSINIDWSWLLWLLLVVLIIALIEGAIKISPAFSQTSAVALQSLVLKFFSLPEWMFNLLLKVVPQSFRKFMTDCMPGYKTFSRGYVSPQNEMQEKLMKESGIKLKYKNGEPDFSPVSKFTVKLSGGINKTATGSDPRKTIHIAQEEAGKQMLNSRKGRKILANYVGKSAEDVTMDDFWSWKDDSLNFGKPKHNPLTPHETIDGKSIQFVPKKWHDVGYGGFKHTGGVSLLKSIRQYFPNAH